MLLHTLHLENYHNNGERVSFSLNTLTLLLFLHNLDQGKEAKALSVLAEQDLILETAGAPVGANSTAASNNSDLAYTLITQREPENKVLVTETEQYCSYEMVSELDLMLPGSASVDPFPRVCGKLPSGVAKSSVQPAGHPLARLHGTREGKLESPGCRRSHEGSHPAVTAYGRGQSLPDRPLLPLLFSITQFSSQNTHVQSFML